MANDSRWTFEAAQLAARREGKGRIAHEMVKLAIAQGKKVALVQKDGVCIVHPFKRRKPHTGQ